MIFVTVGTHEQPFDRLIKQIDQLKEQKQIDEDVFIQTGYSNYMPKFCEWKKMISYDEMQQKIRDAHIVITHGGPASFIAPLKEGKVPIVVPRLKEFDEHVNNHQVEFIKMMYERQGNIIPVFELEKLGNIIKNYDSVVRCEDACIVSNNKQFNEKLEEIAAKLLHKK